MRSLLGVAVSILVAGCGVVSFGPRQEAPTPLGVPVPGVREDVSRAPVSPRDLATRYLTGVMNIRTGAGTGFGIVRKVQAGDSVRVTEPDSNGWARVFSWDRDPVAVGHIYAISRLLSERRPGGTTRSGAARNPYPYVLRSGLGVVWIHSSRDRWDGEHLVAEVPEGTRAELLSRATIDDPAGFELNRCLVRIRSGVRGWVMCGELRRSR